MDTAERRRGSDDTVKFVLALPDEAFRKVARVRRRRID